MPFDTSRHMAVGTKVKIKNPGDPPENSGWDDDGGRTSAMMKKRLQSQFFRGDPKLTAEVMYVPKESERERLRRKGLIKVRVRDQAGCMLNLTADPKNLVSK